jgi:hypothetical protein
MPSPTVTTRQPCLLVVIALALAIAHFGGTTYAGATPSPQASSPPILQCDTAEPICRGDGLTAEILVTAESDDGERWWALIRTSFEPGTEVQPFSEVYPTNYVLYVEAGTLALTADVPVTCIGVCAMQAPAATGTPMSRSPSAVVIPAGREVLLGAGDSAVFEEINGARHVYRNAGTVDAQLLSAVFGPDMDDCKGRCLSPF